MRKRNIKKHFKLSEKELKAMYKQMEYWGLDCYSYLVRKLIDEYNPLPPPTNNFYEVMSKLKGLSKGFNDLAHEFNRNNYLDEKLYNTGIRMLNELMDEVRKKFFDKNGDD